MFLAEQGVIPADWTKADDTSMADSSGVERTVRQAHGPRGVSLSNPQVWAAAFKHPSDQLVRMDSNRREMLIANTGYEFLKEYSKHPLAAR